MRLECEALGRQHWAASATLLAEAYAAYRRREPALRERYEDPQAAYDLLSRRLDGAEGVAAFRDGRLVGYLAALIETESLERIAVALPPMMALVPGEGAETWREMYAAAAERWLLRGSFVHYVCPAAVDETVVGAFFSLGFGQYSVYNWRDLTPVAGPEAELAIRQVDLDGFDDVWQLRQGLWRYNATSPILHAGVRPAGAASERWVEEERAKVADGRNAFFVGYRDGLPVGLTVFTPPEPDYLLTPDGAGYLWLAYVDEDARAGGIGAAMVNRGFAWAREQGYELCTVGYYAPNLLGARFWQSKGFKPLGYTLERRIDPRIAWARGEAR
jgi:GNAT superfamily N-acetyltransferase